MTQVRGTNGSLYTNTKKSAPPKKGGKRAC
jgi:hypothetical protein